MDISLKLKRAVATLSAVALLVSNASVAFAQTFNDVATNAWYYDYVEQLVDDGVVDAADNFRPNDSLNRAELVKMVITAIDGLSGYEAPATPTFDDVPTSAWFYDYVEAAVQLDIVGGYTDAAGNPTGKFGPGDTVNRAAATKILVNAFGVPTDLNPASKFSDVSTGAWYHDYVVTAYNQSILDGYANGKFGPSDPVTRAQVAKLVVNAQNPVERASSPSETPTSTSEGALELSLNDETPASVTVPKSASNVKLLGIDVTAAEDDVAVTNLVVTRGGVGNASDWANLYIYNGAERLTTGRTLNNDTNTVTFPVNLTVDAGTTATLWLVGEMSATGTANNQHYFYVASASDVTSNAQSVAGDFPVAGNTFTTGGVEVNTVTVTTGTAIAQPMIGGMDQEISSFKITAGADNDVAVHQIALTQNGSLASSKLINLKLLRGTDVVATAEGFDGDLVTFVLDTPYVIDEGQNKTFYVRADIDGGRTTDTVQIYLDENTDLVAIDQQYGFGAVVSNSTTTGFKPGAAAPLVTATTLKGGEVTVTDNGPAATQIAQNTTNVQLLNYSITAGRDLRVKDMDATITLARNGGTSPEIPTTLTTDTITATGGTADQDIGEFCINTVNADLDEGDTVSIPTASGTVYTILTADAATDAGECDGAGDAVVRTNETGTTAVTVGGTVSEINPYTLVKNVKIVDLDSGSTLQGPITRASDATKSGTTNTTYSKQFNEDYNLTGGETRHLSVQADIDQNMPDGYTVTVNVNYTTAVGYIKDDAANENIAIADIVGGNLTGKSHSTANNSLAVATASSPTSQIFVNGETDVPSIGVALTAGDAGDITVKKLIVRAYGNTAANNWADAEGDTDAKTLISSITLYDGNNVVAGPKSIQLVDANGTGYTAGTDYYRATFDNMNLVVAKGGTKTLTAKVKLNKNTAGATRYIALDVLPSEDITAEDKEANTITAQGTQLNGGVIVAKSPLITILTSGTLSANAEGSPDGTVLVAGKSMQLAAKYRFGAVREAFTVNKVTVVNDGDNDGFDNANEDTNAIESIVVKYTDINGVSQTSLPQSLTSGKAVFSSLGMYVPKGGESYIEIYVTLPALEPESRSGKTFRLGLLDTGTFDYNDFEAVGAASSTTVDTNAEISITNPTDVETFTLRKAKPTFERATAGSGALAGTDVGLYGVKISADAASVSIARMVYDVTVSGLSDAGDDITSFKISDGSNIATANVDIYCTDSAGANASELEAGTTGLEDCDGTSGNGIANGTYKVIVSFLQEQTVTANSSKTFTLKATPSGMGGGATETVTTKLASGDESTAVSALTVNNGNANTGRIYSHLATSGLFGNNDANATDDAASRQEFSRFLGTARNFIWSDNSADTQGYFTQVNAAGFPDTGTGSYDWTNGFSLKISDLSATGLSD